MSMLKAYLSAGAAPFQEQPPTPNHSLSVSFILMQSIIGWCDAPTYSKLGLEGTVSYCAMRRHSSLLREALSARQALLS